MSDNSKTASSKRVGHKWQIVLGVVVAVMVVAGAGLFVWHEQPSFCGAICHTPMDGYLETYEAQPGSAAVDKYGNAVTDSSGMLAAVHRAENGDTCMSCHVPTLGEQVGEGLAWLSGDYEVFQNGNGGATLEEKTLTQLTAARGISGEEFCLNEACHNMTRADLVVATNDMTLNPHISQHGVSECSDCHKAHRASVLTCTKCHEDADVPAGWLSYQEMVA